MKKTNKISIGIIGYGRMGALLQTMFDPIAQLIDIRIYDRNNLNPQGVFTDLKTTCNADIVIPCVPIDAFESCIQQITPYLSAEQTILHICSIQIYPKNVLLKELPENINIIGSHPMFGPQTFRANNNSFRDLNFVIDPIRCPESIYQKATFFLRSIGLNVVEMDAETHDKKAAQFHFVSHLVANILTKMELESTPIDTKSYEVLFQFLDRIDPDINLMKSMLKHNPYAQSEAKKFAEQYNAIDTLLFPK